MNKILFITTSTDIKSMMNGNSIMYYLSNTGDSIQFSGKVIQPEGRNSVEPAILKNENISTIRAALRKVMTAEKKNWDNPSDLKWEILSCFTAEVDSEDNIIESTITFYHDLYRDTYFKKR